MNDNTKTKAHELGLQVISTTDQMNGYPCRLIDGVVGFENFEQAKDFADENGLNLCMVKCSYGWQHWYRFDVDCVFEPIKITSNDFGDDYNLYTVEESKWDIVDCLQQRIQGLDEDSFDEFTELVEEAKKNIDTLKELEEEITSETQKILWYYGEPVKVQDTEVCEFNDETDSKIYAIAAIEYDEAYGY